MAKNCVNQYVLVKGKDKYEWYEHDLMSYIDDLSYEHFVSDMVGHFATAGLINFDITHHQCRGDELKNLIEYYKSRK